MKYWAQGLGHCKSSAESHGRSAQKPRGRLPAAVSTSPGSTLVHTPLTGPVKRTPGWYARGHRFPRSSPHRASPTSVTGQGLSILGPGRHAVFVTAARVCYGPMKTAPARTSAWPAAGRAVPTKLYLWRLKSEFHKVFPRHTRLCASFLTLGNLRTNLTLSLWALQKQEADQMWLSGLGGQAHTCAPEAPFRNEHQIVLLPAAQTRKGFLLYSKRTSKSCKSFTGPGPSLPLISPFVFLRGT